MEINGYLTRISGDTVQVKLKDIGDSQQYILNENIGSEVNLLVDDGRSITNKQRKKIYSMFHDIANYTGYSDIETKEVMKTRFICVRIRPEWFSLSNCSLQLAKEFIEFMINFCLRNDIPFSTKMLDEIQQSYQLRYRLVKHRLCFICGKPYAQIDHYKAIGSGRNRNTIYQVGMPVWSLCSKHHDLKHHYHPDEFAKMFQIKPIKLTPYLVKYLNIGNINANRIQFHWMDYVTKPFKVICNFSNWQYKCKAKPSIYRMSDEALSDIEDDCGIYIR